MDHPSASFVLSKQEKQWNKQLNQHLDRYSYLRDWSQLASWLSKLKHHVNEYKGIVLDKVTLLRRLSTSLNPSLPIALHESTLEIYEVLFSNVITSDSLQHTCIGLFPFYSMANIKNKQKVIELFFRFLPNFGGDLKVLITGLLITILPSFIQMHEPLVKDVSSFLDLLCKSEIIGTEMLFESIWISILRSPVCRIAGLKYISSKLGKGAIQDENDEEDTFWNETAIKKDKNQEIIIVNQVQNNDYSPTKQLKLKQVQSKEAKDTLKQFCPSIDTLVVNALIICIQDSNTLVVKSALDFMYKYLPIRSEILSDKSKLSLATPVIWLLGKRDMSVTRKINLWLFGKPDDENRYLVNQKNIKFIINPIKQFLKLDTTIEPLKIIFNLYSQHENLPQLTLQFLAKELIYFSMKQDNNPQILKLMHRLIDRSRDQVYIFSNSLGKELLHSINEKEYREAERVLQLIFYLVSKILKPEELKLVIFDILKNMVESYRLTFWKDREYMKNSLRQTLQILEKHKELFKELKLTEDQIKILKTHDQLYEELMNNVEKNENQSQYEQEISFITKMQVKVYQIFEVYDQKWVPNLIRNVSLKNPHHFLSPIEVIGEAMEKEGLLKLQILKRSQQAGKFNIIKVSLQKIWNILSLGHLQAKLVPLLIRIIKFFPHYFQTLLEQEFQCNSEMTIIKFNLFWQIGPKYLHIISNDQLQQVCKPGLFKMLEFLDNGNPLVKYNTNIWINECFPSFHRVLNPLLEIMLKPKDFWYRTPQGQFVYVITPETAKLMKVINHMKSIIKHTGSKFNKFSLKPITPKLLPYYEVFKGVQFGQHEILSQQQSYLGVILELIVRFTESKYINLDNPGVDLAACEVLEVLIKNINSSELSNHVLKYNINDLLNSLHFATVNEEHLLQIQILNLLKIVFFQSNIRKHAQAKLLKEVISNNLFIKTILEGLNSSFPYIKQRFVEFINFSIQLFLEYHTNCSEIISRILNTYTTKISYINSKKIEISNVKDLQISKKNAQILILFNGIKELVSYFLNMQIRPFEKQKSQGDTDSGVFSLYSWKSYVELKIDKKSLDSTRAKKFMEQISKQIINQLQQLIYTMTSCWTLSQLVPYYKLSTEGLALFNYEEFHTFNKQLYLTLGKFQNQETIQNFIINFVRVLINAYPSQVMNGMINNWASAKTVDLKLKVLQILNFCSLPIEYFYSTIADSINSQKIGKKRKVNQLQFQKSIEQDIIQMCQVFTHYNFQNFSVFQAHNLLSIWMSFCKFLKIFQNTKNVLTLYALLELIDLFMKKNNPKEIIKDQKLKKEILPIISYLNDLIFVCSGKIKISTLSKDNVGFASFLPLPSSIFDHYISEVGNPNEAKSFYLFFNEINAVSAIQYCRIHGFLIAKRLSYNLLMCLHNDSQIVLVRKIREVVVHFLPIVEDKAQDSILVECASDLILKMLQKKPVFLKEFKHDILQIFNKDDFFICSSKTLHTWAKIIDLIIDNNKDHDIFNEYLDKVSLVSSIFSSYNLQTKKKIKSFERICFILYSGRKDKYNDKAHLLIDKIIEVIKNSEAPQPVLILIFFCIRILILRMSPQKLTKLLSNMWLMIIILLMNIFNDSIQQKNRLNLLWAALKLIEMISIMQIQEFQCHQWMFFYDFVGIKLTNEEVVGKQIKLNIKPKIHKFLSEDLRVEKSDIIQSKEKRHLIIKQDKIDDIQLLKTKALLLSSYLISNNECKMRFDMKEIEELIDNDFLNLDEFIFKFK